MLLFTIESHMYNMFSVRGPFGVAADMVTILKLHAAVALNRSRSTLVILMHVVCIGTVDVYLFC